MYEYYVHNIKQLNINKNILNSNITLYLVDYTDKFYLNENRVRYWTFYIINLRFYRIFTSFMCRYIYYYH